MYEACERFKSLGIEFKKTPNSGGTGSLLCHHACAALPTVSLMFVASMSLMFVASMCCLPCSDVLCMCVGGMKGLAFIKDPDGYLIEVLPKGK